MKGVILLLVLLGVISSVVSVHNITEALAALAPVLIDDPETAISLMQNDAKVTHNGSIRCERNFGLVIAWMVAVIYIL